MDRLNKSSDRENVWHEEMPGSLLVQAQKTMLNRWLKQNPVETILQVGGACGFDWIEGQCEPLVFRLVENACMCHKKAMCVCADFTRLPIAPASMDVVLLPNIFIDQKNRLPILQEACYALKPNGKLVILGLNTRGLWYFMRSLGWRDESINNQCFLSSKKVISALHRLGLSVVFNQSACFRPPIKNKKLANALLFLEMFGQVFCPSFGAGFMLVAQKEVAGTTKIAVTNYQRKKGWVAGAARSANRSLY